MPDRTPYNFPFFALFLRLRNSGFMLELEDYYDLLEALRGGFGMVAESADREEQIAAFRRLCLALWVKSPAEKDLFDQQFALFLATRPQGSEKPKVDKGEKPREQTGTEGQTREKDRNQHTEDESDTDEAETGPNRPLDIPPPQIRTRELPDPYVPGRHRFLLSKHYFPIGEREMQQSWRHLHRPVRIGIGRELDLVQTVRHFARNGYLETPSYLPIYANQVRLHLLVDRGGSMQAYDDLCRQLVLSARSGGRVLEVTAHYFRNVPGPTLYRDEARTQAVDFTDFLRELNPLRSSVLILSDAGAARGTNNLRRLFQTEEFLEELHGKTLRVAWLNPFPPRRWQNTTAEALTELVPMFPLSRAGLDRAIAVLKGKTF